MLFKLRFLNRVALTKLHWSVALLLLIVCGCAELKTSSRDYQTIVVDPSKNTSRAMDLNCKGANLLEHGKVRKAERAFREALIADVDYGPAHNNLGRMYFSVGDYYLAAWEFDNAIRLMPGQAEPLNNLGLVYASIDKQIDAVYFLAQARDLAPDNPEYVGNLARARYVSGDRTTELREMLEEVVFLDTRQDWISWAQELLATAKFDTPQIIIDADGKVGEAKDASILEDVDSKPELPLEVSPTTSPELPPSTLPFEISNATASPSPLAVSEEKEESETQWVNPPWRQ